MPGVRCCTHQSESPTFVSDAFAVAVAINQKAMVLTGDPEFESIETLVNVEWLNR